MRIRKLMDIFKRDEKGFTLVEILVVIGILAILAAVLLPKIFNRTTMAKEKADELQAKTLTQAVYAYKAAENGSVPTLRDLQDRHYIDEIPKQQSNGKDFTINSDGSVTVTP